MFEISVLFFPFLRVLLFLKQAKRCTQEGAARGGAHTAASSCQRCCRAAAAGQQWPVLVLCEGAERRAVALGACARSSTQAGRSWQAGTASSPARCCSWPKRLPVGREWPAGCRPCARTKQPKRGSSPKEPAPAAQGLAHTRASLVTTSLVRCSAAQLFFHETLLFQLQCLMIG